MWHLRLLLYHLYADGLLGDELANDLFVRERQFGHPNIEWSSIQRPRSRPLRCNPNYSRWSSCALPHDAHSPMRNPARCGRSTF